MWTPDSEAQDGDGDGQKEDNVDRNAVSDHDMMDDGFGNDDRLMDDALGYEKLSGGSLTMDGAVELEWTTSRIK